MLKSAFILLFLMDVTAAAQTRTSVLNPAADPRGPSDLTICSQNLALFGSYADSSKMDPELSEVEYDVKTRSLARRFARAGCDVIAVQEVLGKDEVVAQEALHSVIRLIKSYTNRIFDARVGPSNDPKSRVGFLFAKDKTELMSSLTYNNVELPKLSPNQKPREFSRGPLEIQLRVKGAEGAASKLVTLVNFHFKSKRGGGGDPAELEWETWRMEMAEAVRRVVESRHAQSFQSGDTILVVLGDRNSNFDVASAKILEGTLRLRNFQDTAPCRLSNRGVPLCQAGMTSPQRLFSVLTTDPQTKILAGTFKYGKEYSWLDEISMPSDSLRYAWTTFDSLGDYDSGVLSDYADASDHSLVWVKLNW